MIDIIVNSGKEDNYTENVWKNKKNQTVLTGDNKNKNELIEKAQEDFKNKKDYVDNIIEGNHANNINKL